MSTKFYIKPALREDAVRLLQAARNRVVRSEGNGPDMFVCTSLMNAAHANRVLLPAYRALQKQIERALGNRHFTVRSWLCSQIGEEAVARVDMHAYRLAWIDEMIAQIEVMQ